MSSTSHDQTPSPTPRDVFLSFRGKDTRYTFTGHLYAALDRTGIRTFMDDRELHGGEVISSALLQAIKVSKTYVVVISENYASSRWCLDELVEILGCYKTTHRLVIPVFYNIEPSVVRYQTGSFNEAFQKHETRFDMEKVNKWRLTLTEVSDFSGKEISAERSEADIIKEIVHTILCKTNPRFLNVTKYPVGLDSNVEGITALLSSYTERIHGNDMGRVGQTNLARKIGIYGMGGIGKTTLAKAVYNENYNSFQGSCFLLNVREVSKKKGLECLQQQLLNNVLNQNIKIDNVDQGIELIRARICSIKVLIVIDDLDDPIQLKYLEGPFALGSIIIITTRNVDVLDTINVGAKYKVNELGDADSFLLFIQHAFGVDKIDKIPNMLTKLSKEIIECAGGLPLALEDFARKLFGNEEEEVWRFFIDSFKRFSSIDVEEKLKISFDALEKSDYPMLPGIFLDIACFFIGLEEEKVVKIMETYYESINHNIGILKKRCLLTVSHGDKLGMHRLNREMGRKIARNDSPNEPRKHSRLWISNDILHVLKKGKGTKAIEGIIPQNLCYEDALEGVSFAPKTFERMSKLRFLYLENVNLEGSFRQIFEVLRFLHWKCCPLTSLPSEFYPEELVILELPHSKMITMRELNNVFEKLKTLDMSYSLDLTTIPDFAKFPRLETLNLEGCKSLEEVHVSIGRLERLVSLNLHGCVKLTSLPYAICHLGTLEILSIGDCSSLKALPTELGKIKSLKVLDAEGLPVSELSDSIGLLSNLVELRLSKNKNLEILPDNICQLRSLEILDISRCVKLKKLPDQLWKLTRLREINAGGATMLNKLPDIESSQISLSLQKLDLSENVFTELPSGFSQLSNLENLNLEYCRHLLSIAEFPPNLKEIRAYGCTSMKELPNLSNLKQLETMNLTNCGGLTKIQCLEELTSLKELHLGGCNSSLLVYTLTKQFFQIISGFGHQINIYAPPSFGFLDWNSQSADCNSQLSEYGSTMSLSLLPNVSHNFLGMILCFKHSGEVYEIDYSVKTTTSDLIWRDTLYTPDNHKSLMVILPKSIFSVRDSDKRIELTANAKIHGIHLLYKKEYDRTTINAEDERIESCPSRQLDCLEVTATF